MFPWPPGTSQSNWYYLSPTDFKAELRGTCHHDEVNDIIFPRDCSDLFVSCSHCDIRVWNANLREEVLRIQVTHNTHIHCQHRM